MSSGTERCSYSAAADARKASSQAQKDFGVLTGEGGRTCYDLAIRYRYPPSGQGEEPRAVQVRHISCGTQRLRGLDAYDR